MKKMWFQMGIRELLGLATILALGIALYLSNRDNQDMRTRYSQLLPKLSLVVPVCLETRYVNGASISVMGTLFHSKDERWANAPTVTVQLIDPKTNAVIRELKEQVMLPKPEGHVFALTMHHTGTLPEPGIYLILVEACDGPTEIDRSCTAIEIVK